MGQSEPQHEETLFGTDCPRTPFIPTAIVKLMSYVCNRLQWLEETALRESLALILDRQRQLEETQKVVYLCFSWRQHAVLGLQGWREPYTNINDQAGRTPRHISAGSESWNTQACQDGTENFLVSMSLRGEITMVKSKIIVLQQL